MARIAATWLATSVSRRNFSAFASVLIRSCSAFGRLSDADTGGTDNILQAELSPSEVTLPAYLMQRPGIVVSCQELCRALGYEASTEEAQVIVRPHISRLRR